MTNEIITNEANEIMEAPYSCYSRVSQETKRQVARNTCYSEVLHGYITTFDSEEALEDFRAFLHRNGFRPGGRGCPGYEVKGPQLIWAGMRGEGIARAGDPRVGDVATQTLYTDTVAYDVIKTTKTTATLRERTAIKVSTGHCIPGGFAGHWDKHPTWATIPNYDGDVIKCSRRTTKLYRPDPATGATKKIFYKVIGWGTKSPGGRVRFGVAYAHTDYNF